METLRRCFRGRPPGGGAVSYSRHRDPRGGGGEQQEEGDPIVRLPRPGPRPRRRTRPQPRPRLHPLATLALGSASAFLAGLLVAGIGHVPCGGGTGAGPDPGGSAPEEVGGGARAEAPPTWPRLRELLQRHLREERVEAWVREVSAGPHGAGSERGRGLAQAVLSAMVGAGLSRAWSRLQPLPLPTRGSASLAWVDAGGRELERLRLDPEAFCAWSAPGNATGGLVYGHYGRPQDLALLRGRGVSPRGNLLLLRLGRGPRPPRRARGTPTAGGSPPSPAGPPPPPGLPPSRPPPQRRRRRPPAAEGAWGGRGARVPPGAGTPPPTPGSLGRGGRGPGRLGPPRTPGSCPPLPPRRVLGGPRAPAHWGPPGRGLRYEPGPGGRRLRLSVASGTEPGTLTSVFGALEGRLEPDCYIIVGAQRDSLGPGAAASGVDTALLLELAHLFAAMGRDGFQLRRTLLFVSWDGGEFGHLGATEWLEGYPDLLHTKAAAYISLDQAVLGDDRFVAKTSPTLVNLIESVLGQVESPNEGGKSLLEQVTRPGRGWESDVIRPLPPESGAFPFTAAAGVPAVELGFDEAPGGWSRAALGTREDTLGRLQGRLRGRLPAVARAVAAVAAQLLLHLGHDARLPLDPGALGDALLRRLAPLQARGLSLQCLSSARGDVVRAAETLRQEMAGSEGTNERLNRGFNARIMAAEASLLSPFVSPLVTPFRHVLLGRGGHTLPALAAQLGRGHGQGTQGDTGHLRLRLALLAWTLQGTAGALAGDAWDRGDIGDRGDIWDHGGLGDVGGHGDNGDSWDGGGRSAHPRPCLRQATPLGVTSPAPPSSVQREGRGQRAVTLSRPYDVTGEGHPVVMRSWRFPGGAEVAGGDTTGAPGRDVTHQAPPTASLPCDITDLESTGSE
ncbi:transferrin receptor protein 2 [Ciconia boyciana]|uniref:transferrin receptor protein 2 n=1 Tax=Ciconia boyciana TaxID=52775 RepID=UPI003B9F467F